MNPTELLAHPFTGEVIGSLTEQSSEKLADVLDALRSRRAQLGAMADAVEGELRARLSRLGPNRRMAVFGEWEVAAGSRRRVWDGAELEGVLNELVESGALALEEARGVVTFEPKVSGKEALRVMARLDGPPRAQVEACFQWKDSSKLEVVRSVQLLPDGSDAEHAHQPERADAASLPIGGDPEQAPAVRAAAPTDRRGPLTPEELFS